MHPVLFKIPIGGGLPIYGYGLMIAFAFVLGSTYVWHESRRLGLNASQSMDLIFFKLWEGGLVFYGGLIGGLIATAFFLKKYHLPRWTYCDLFIVPLSLGHAIGRIGCFLAGCCYGRPLLHPAWYGVIFPHTEYTIAPYGVPLYPTQLMESAAEFMTFLFLFFWRKKKKADGELLALYLMIYAVVRSVIEVFRGDFDRGFLIEPWLSTSQTISIAMFGLGLLLFFYRRKKARPQ